MPTNKYGLSRDIPDDIKRQVRQRDGFGCIVCGSAFYQYDHSPAFAEIRAHTVEGIRLLCPTCHNNRGKFLSEAAIEAAAKNPKCRQLGFALGAFNLGFAPPLIMLGGLGFREVVVLLRVLDEDILSVKPPEVAGGPFRLSASLRDSEGNLILKIVDNEWQTPSDNWDVEIVGGVITIRSALRQIILALRVQPDAGRISIETLRMQHRGLAIETMPGGASFRVGTSTLQLVNSEVHNLEFGITYTSDGRLGVTEEGRWHRFRDGKSVFIERKTA